MVFRTYSHTTSFLSAHQLQLDIGQLGFAVELASIKLSEWEDLIPKVAQTTVHL